MVSNEEQYVRLRNILGFLGCMLPVLCIAGAAISPNTQYPDWWTSISITYYSSPVLIAILTSVSLFLIVYRGYDKWDTIVNTTAGICGLGVVCFPCEASWLDMSTKVGLFWLPINITRWFHYTTAGLLFLMLALNSIILFSKSSSQKKNKIYKICGYVILADLVFFFINAVFLNIQWTVIVNETIMLFAFGISWLVKGHLFDKFISE